MKNFSALVNNLSWSVWTIVVVLNVLGVTHVPWNVAIAPLIVTGVFGIAVGVGILSNKDKIKEALEEREKEKKS